MSEGLDPEMIFKAIGWGIFAFFILWMIFKAI